MSAVDILLIIQWIAVGILFFLLVYASAQKSTELSKHLIVVIAATIFFLLGYNLELRAETQEAALLSACLSYIGEPFVLLGEFMIICTFYERRISKKLFITLAVIAVIIPILVFTNNYHHLYYTSVSFDESLPFSSLVVEHGPLYWLNVAMSVFYFAAFVFVIYKGTRHGKSKMKKRLTIYTVLMVVCGFGSFFIHSLGITGGYDATMIGLSLSSVFLTILFFRCKLFDIVDKAKEYALDISNDGLIIFNDANEISYENPSAKSVVLMDIPIEKILSQTEATKKYESNGNIYSVNVTQLYNKGIYLGKSVEIYDITATANNQARLEAAVKAATTKLANIHRSVFGSLASIVEARSLETGDHIHRVSNYTSMIANELKKNPKYAEVLTDDYINTLVLSSPLHDIGKISVSDTILLKPGRLTPEEFEEMKKHSASGADIIKTTMSELEDRNYIDMAVDIARYHHERFDGTGYPDKLAGEDIPLSARIVAVADCYDALTSVRCYKDAFPNEKALAILKEEAGSHFDPAIVDAFLNCK